MTSERPPLSRPAVTGLLSLVLLAALALRIWGLGFGLPAATARPDETQIAGAALGFLSGDLRPPFFEWPMLLAYVTALGYIVLVAVSRPFGGWATLAVFAESRRQSIAPFLLVPRALAAVLGVLTVWWVYRLCRRVFDETVALIAALFLACAFLHVRDSHFGVTDEPMTALVVCAVLLIVRWRDRGGLWPAAAAGAVSGLAISTKYNGALVAVAFAAAWSERIAATPPPRPIARPLASLLAYATAMAVAFLCTSPYILVAWPQFVADISKVQVTFGGGNGLVLGQGYTYYATTILPAAIGWPMFVASVGGLVVLLISRFRVAIPVLAFPLVYYAVAGRGYAVFARYILPVVPFLCVSAAWFVVWLSRMAARRWPPAGGRALIVATAIAVVSPTAWSSVHLDRLLSQIDNRVLASREVYRVVQPGDGFYQSGEPYGQAPPILDGHRWPVENAFYEAATERFAPKDPDWVLIQRSPLSLYSAVPAGLEKILEQRYRLERAFPVSESQEGTRSLYDQQDAFFLPLTGLRRLDRPGPAFELYQRRH